MTASLSIVMVGLVILAFIVRDAWLRTLEARRRVISEDDRARVDEAVTEFKTKLAKVSETLDDHHARLVAQERKAPSPRRA